MAKYEKTVKGNYSEVLRGINEAVLNSGVSMTLVDSCSKDLNGVRTYVAVFDKYYMRNSSRASLTVSITGDDQKVHVSAIGAGGGQGALFRFSWGAEDNILNPVKEYLARYEGKDLY